MTRTGTPIAAILADLHLGAADRGGRDQLRRVLARHGDPGQRRRDLGGDDDDGRRQRHRQRHVVGAAQQHDGQRHRVDDLQRQLREHAVVAAQQAPFLAAQGLAPRRHRSCRRRSAAARGPPVSAAAPAARRLARRKLGLKRQMAAANSIAAKAIRPTSDCRSPLAAATAGSSSAAMFESREIVGDGAASGRGQHGRRPASPAGRRRR